MDSLREHIDNEFESSLPLWVERTPIIEGIKKTVVDAVYDLVSNYSDSSDYFVSDTARNYKQDDVSLHEINQSLFKDKLKILFARGTKRAQSEIRRIVRAGETYLLEGTELFEETPLNDAKVAILRPEELVSGFILGVTYPSLNRVSLSDLGIVPTDDFNEFVFSESKFLVVNVVNNSDFSDNALERILRREILPFQIPIIINIS